ncbi:MAG: cation-translocating P-type ATPase [Betaproteobacteria bacterium]|nr:cation-translocating P-type ATPase [Betaproteobacteria bacterium]
MIDEYQGLDAATVAARQAAEGPNILSREPRRTFWAIAAEISREPMFLLLLGAGLVYLVLGKPGDALALLGFVIIIMGVTIAQERRTERTLEALRDLSSPRALAIRDGVPMRIAGRDVVRDDLLALVEGDRVPADAWVLQAHELAVDESLLTGESVPVAKAGAAPGAPAADEVARVYAGTLVVRGQGLVRVTAIGDGTRLGAIGRSLETVKFETSPLQQELARLTKRLAWIALAFCLLLVGLYWALRGGFLEGALAGITLAMAILPQEIPVILIVFLALGARRISRHRVLTRRLNAIETLGETTVLCVDKTGTLTQNRMTLSSLCVEGQVLDVGDLAIRDLPERYHLLLEYAVLASEIEPHDPMERAFHSFAHDYLAHTEHLHADWALVREYELTPELPAMTHLWQPDDGSHAVVAAKGAPEAVADLCHLPEAMRREVARQSESMADRGLRVLGVARAVHRGESWPDAQHDFDFEWVGLAGLSDPLRPEVPAAVRLCRNAHIRIVMITGDHPRTARAIAQGAGIDCRRVITGAEMESWSQEMLDERVAQTCVFARVTPAQKLLLVNALKRRGEIVAMTGDGVNDAPALKSAHIGVAMGKRGTDVAREAASLVLLEDDFSAIVTAIELGRRIYANLRQALVYTIAVHVPTIGLSLLPVLMGWPPVLAPVHIAFLELVIDPACSVVFEAEEGGEPLMDNPPRATTEALLSNRQLVMSLTFGLLATAVVCAQYLWAVQGGVQEGTARAMTFVALIGANIALILASRSPRPGVGRLLGRLSKTALRVLVLTVVGLVCVTAWPPLATLFSFRTLTPQSWLAAFGLGLATVLPLELAKRALSGVVTKP